MNLQTKALYNLLRLNYLEDPSMICEKWQVEDLTKIASAKLFSCLKSLGVSLNEKKFFIFSKDSDSPEEFADLLLQEYEEIKNRDEIFLYIFELWRRLIPEKQSVSIFCNELDWSIYRYDTEQVEDDEFIQDGLANLEEILDENVDIGAEPSKIFQSLAEYCAHDLECFLYSYISEQIDIDNLMYASELIDGFYPYMQDVKWFDLLKARLLSFDDIIQSNEIITRLLKELKKEPDLDLQLEVLRFMVQAGDRKLFTTLVKKTLMFLKKEEDFLDLLDIVADYYRRLDIEEIEKSVQRIMSRRISHVSTKDINQKDPDLKEIQKLVSR